KQIIRWICNSDAYQLKAVTNKTNDKAEDEVYFSRQMLKAMSPEQLFDSLLAATQPSAKRNEDEQRKLRADWLRKLSLNFGDDEGNELTFNGTVVQALLMMNGKDLNGALNAANGTVDRAKRLTGSAQINHLFLAAYNRPATPKEISQIQAAASRVGVREND